MLIVDLPEAPPSTPAIVIAQTNSASVPRRENVAGACQPINYRTIDRTTPDPNNRWAPYWDESEGGISPQDIAVYYLMDYIKKRNVPRPAIDAVEVLVPPKYGQVKRGTNAAGGNPRYNYVPDVDFIGQDKVVFRVITAEGPVTVRYYLQVTDKGGDRVPPERFCKWLYWKISSTPDDTDKQSNRSQNNFASAGN